MKKIFERWKQDKYTSLTTSIGGWLYTRTQNIKDEQDKKQAICLCLAELAVRVVEEDLDFAPQVLDAIFNNQSLSQDYNTTKSVARHIAARCQSDDNWGVIPPILYAIGPSDTLLWRCDEFLREIAKAAMAGPSKFTHITQDFDEHSKQLLLPYCIAQDPYNASFVSEEWGIELFPKHIFQSIVINTQGLRIFEDIEMMKPVASLITVSDMIEQLQAHKNLPEEFSVLVAAVKNMKKGNLVIDVNKFSWGLRDKPEIICKKWMDLLSFATPIATPNDHYILQKMDDFANTYNVSFTDLSSKMQKAVILEELSEQSSPSRVQRKM